MCYINNLFIYDIVEIALNKTLVILLEIVATVPIQYIIMRIVIWRSVSNV